MKKQYWIAVMALLLLYAIPSNAQCGMYTYHDMWMDDNGNAVGENYAQVTGCYQTATYTEVHMTLPSGYQVVGSGTGSTVAEALTQASATSESGDGSLSGYSEAFSNVCYWYDSGSFISFIHIDECACSLSGLESGNCRLPCNCIPGFNSEAVVQTPDRLAQACQRVNTTIPPGTCPSVVVTTRLSVGLPDAFVSFDRVNECYGLRN